MCGHLMLAVGPSQLQPPFSFRYAAAPSRAELESGRPARSDRASPDHLCAPVKLAERDAHSSAGETPAFLSPETVKRVVAHSPAVSLSNNALSGGGSVSAL